MPRRRAAACDARFVSPVPLAPQRGRVRRPRLRRPRSADVAARDVVQDASAGW